MRERLLTIEEVARRLGFTPGTAKQHSKRPGFPPPRLRGGIATAREFCELKTEWGRVLYIIGEGNESEFSNRLRAWIKQAESECRNDAERDALRKLIENNLRVVTSPIMVNVESQVRDLLRQNPGKWDLVVIDTLMRNTSGNVNDPKDAADFIRGCDAIREETGTAVAVAHHQGKDEKRGAFGSMHYTGACDGAALIFAKGEERFFRIKLMRNGDDRQDDIVYRLAPSLVRMTEAGEQVSCVVRFIERRRRGQAATDLADADPLDMLLWRIHNDKPDSPTKFADLIGMKLRTLERRLSALRKRGELGDGLTLTDAGVAKAMAFDAEDAADDDDEDDDE